MSIGQEAGKRSPMAKSASNGLISMQMQNYKHLGVILLIQEIKYSIISFWDDKMPHFAMQTGIHNTAV